MSVLVYVSVSVSVSVFVCLRSYLRNYTSDLHQIFVHVNYGRGSAFSGAVVICYVFLVLWMTSYLHIS